MRPNQPGRRPQNGSTTYRRGLYDQSVTRAASFRLYALKLHMQGTVGTLRRRLRATGEIFLHEYICSTVQKQYDQVGRTA